MPDLHAGGPGRHRGRHARAARPRGRAARGDRGRHRPARKRDLDGQDVPEARHVRGPDVERRDVLRPARAELLRARREDREGQAPRPRLVLDALRARRGPHRRPHEPLQHDVQPVLHGREPGRVRPRARLGRHQEDPRQRRSRSSRSARCRSSSPGGEPTISPLFLEAMRYAREIGYFSVQCATNGIRFAQEPEFAKAADEAGLRLAYLQFDGVGNEAERAPRGRQPLRREAARDRQPRTRPGSTSRS